MGLSPLYKCKDMKNIFIGVDFSKKTFDATMIREGEEENVVLGYSKFDNNEKGYKHFLCWAKKTAHNDALSEWLVCGENTGFYSMGLADWTYEHQMDIWIENAYSIKHSLGLTRGKNDKLDSLRIATFAQEKKLKAHLYKPLQQTLSELKTMIRRRQILDTARKAILNGVKEFEEMFAPTGEIEKLDNKLKEVAKSIKDLENDIERLMAKLCQEDPEIWMNYCIVHSVKGIGTINTVAMLVYTANFTKYATANKMATAWGVAPFKDDSGTSLHAPARVSSFCNHWLKGLLTCSAVIAVQTDSKMSAYYHKLIERGKQRGVALNNVKSKLIHIVFAMVKNQTMYDPDYDVKKKDTKTQTVLN